MLSGRLGIHTLTPYFMWHDISLHRGWNAMKLATHIHHISGNCWKGFQGQKSKFKVVYNNCCKLCCYNSYFCSPEDTISCVQMCDCYNGGGIHFNSVVLLIVIIILRVDAHNQEVIHFSILFPMLFCWVYMSAVSFSWSVCEVASSLELW